MAHVLNSNFLHSHCCKIISNFIRILWGKNIPDICLCKKCCFSNFVSAHSSGNVHAFQKATRVFREGERENLSIIHKCPVLQSQHRCLTNRQPARDRKTICILSADVTLVSHDTTASLFHKAQKRAFWKVSKPKRQTCHVGATPSNNFMTYINLLPNSRVFECAHVCMCVSESERELFCYQKVRQCIVQFILL